MGDRAFHARWPFRRVDNDVTPDIAVTFREDSYCVRATSWAGGESLAKDPHNAANALVGLLIDGLLAHGMAAHCLHAAAAEIDGRAVLFCGPGQAGNRHWPCVWRCGDFAILPMTGFC